MSLITIQRGIIDLFENLEQVSRYKDIKFTKFPNGVYRYDVALQYKLIVRFIIDPAKRTQNLYMIGCNVQGKYKAIQHFKYDVDFETFDARSEAKKMVKTLLDLTQKYRYRIRR
jgi:hypothetical protein